MLRNRQLVPPLTIHTPDGRTVRACHPHLHDNADVRGRLHELGLLTSSALRIEFPPVVPAS